MTFTSGLSRWDDLPFHQTIESFGVPDTSDSHFNDGYYFAAYASGVHVFAGLRLHPNNNVMDGYAGVVSEGEQRNQRVSRALLPRRDVLNVGGLSVEIVEPMRRQRVVLATSDVNLSFDLEFESVGEPFVESRHRQVRFGRMINDVFRYTQSCRASGTLVIDGVTTRVERWFGARDHSWGIRSTMGPQVPHGGIDAGDHRDPRALRLWVPFEVGDHSGFFHLHEDADGNVLDCEGRIDLSSGGSLGVVAVKHALRYSPGTPRLSGGEFELRTHDGGSHTYEIEVVCEPAHPQGFGYARGWSDLGQPGVYRGADVRESDRFATNDPARALGPAHVPEKRRLGGTEFACSMSGAAGTGMAHVEHMLYGTYRPYGFTAAKKGE
jgi:hypothetical protein